ncbi:TolC family protein [bacterium]|nr:TolC family protein [bacterium]
MNIKKLLCSVIVISILLAGNIVLAIEEHNHDDLFNPVEVHNGMLLSVIDCVALAFKNSPKIRRAKYELDVAKSNLGIAKSRFFPVIGAGVGFNYERNSDTIYYDKRYRDLPVVGVTVNQLIYDFGKSTSYIKMEEFYKIGAEYEFMDSLCYTLFDIKAKYYNLLKAKALYNVAKNNVEINEKFLSISQKKNKPDITTAQLNLSESKIKFIEAENTLNNAKYNLSNAMYLDFQPIYDIKSTPTFTYNNDYAYGSRLVESAPFEPFVFPFKMDKAIDIAYENSPDLQVLINTKKAMEQSLKYVKRTYLPELSAGAGYRYNNTNFTHNNSLQVGVNLSSSVNLMELKHSIKGADAQLSIADNEVLLFKKDLYYELLRAFNNVERAKKQVPTAKIEVQQALNNLSLVEEKYISDELNYIALQDARKNYIRALDSYIESVYNYNIALIQVEMAMHYHLVDIHHKSEHAVHYHSDELLEHLNKVLDCDQKEIKKSKKK